jgi:hypothetical protein
MKKILTIIIYFFMVLYLLPCYSEDTVSNSSLNELSFSLINNTDTIFELTVEDGKGYGIKLDNNQHDSFNCRRNILIDKDNKKFKEKSAVKGTLFFLDNNSNSSSEISFKIKANERKGFLPKWENIELQGDKKVSKAIIFNLKNKIILCHVFYTSEPETVTILFSNKREGYI